MTRNSLFSKLRPTSTLWFETYTPREQTVHALEVLAATGLVELQSDPRYASPMVIDDVKEVTEKFTDLMRKYGHEFPAVDSALPQVTNDPEQTGNEALHVLRDYCAAVLRLRRREANARKELENLSLIEECRNCPGCDADVLESLFHRTDFLIKRIFACNKNVLLPGNIDKSVYIKISSKQYDFYIDAALPEQKSEINQIFSSCREIKIPEWLIGQCEERHTALRARLVQLEQEIHDIDHQLRTLKQDTAAAEAYAKLDVLKWFVDQSPHLEAAQRRCHVTGWTSAEHANMLDSALKSANIDAKVRFSETPAGIRPPVMSLDSWWVAPFRIFVDLLGAPGKMEVDPSALLPVIVPLLFGFMFCDVGHGLILLIAGLALSSYPKLRLLIPCGLYSMAFGFLFGSFFGHDHFIQPLWFDPMNDPVMILILCLVFGFCLILLSIIFSGVEAYWKGKLKHWLMLELAVLFLYSAALVGAFIHEVLLLIPLALAFYVAGLIRVYHGRLSTKIILGLGNLVKSIFELALNTLSFLRVGIFALAHDAMSHAVNLLTNEIDNTYVFVVALVLGHLLLIAIETLVVFIQTTRLILFEFFIRFFHAEGRVFQPLRLPARKSHRF